VSAAGAIERVLSVRELNRALLARQLLLERSDRSIVEALEQVGGLQTQYAPAGYLGLWSRLVEFRRESLTEALEERRVIQATLMRSTIHMVSAADFWVFLAGIRASRRDWAMRVQRAQLAGIEMDLVAEQLRALLAAGPRRQADLVAAMELEGVPRVASARAGEWVDVVRVPPSGTWSRRRADLYGLADQWLPPVDVSEAEGIVHLVRRYLGAFGPSTTADIARWAGLPATALAPALSSLELRRLRDESGRLLLDLPGAPLPPADTPAPVRFLPVWDAALLVHARRTLILPEAHRPRIFNVHAPQSFPTFLVDGAVAGTWRFAEGHIELEPFEPLTAGVRRELGAEAERLAAFHTE
jgi:hypothetical protein